ncbi:MAG TPA: TetR/AcrR family transcriptional regulator [Candidatus Dormibacteraeota bacterium]|jgi:AcrR family transcriptional regulator|nr:TetR/AcrR family transcriptional regulator [Candidatus Dormibacteraeota bacterium]
MARTERAAQTVRRDAFVDVALRLIQTKGYEQMTVQDVLDQLGASKGAFYHYFDSKRALLEAVVERSTDGALAALAPLLDDPHLSAARKLEEVFAGIAAWKAQRKELMLAILEVWVSDDNAIVREKSRRLAVSRLVPLLEPIIRQGVEEGVFTVPYPDETARTIVALFQGFGDEALEHFFARQAGTIPFETVVRANAAHVDALERILGLSAGSFTGLDEESLRLWFG